MFSPARRFIRCSVCAATLLASGVSVRTSQAAVMLELSVEQMVAGADVIVRGKVVRTGTRVVLKNGELEAQTHTWIDVSEWLSGGKPGASHTIELWEPGGTYADVREEVSGTPHYEVGEEIVAFLSADSEKPGLFRTHQAAQGKYRVLPSTAGLSPDVNARAIVRDLDDVSFATWNTNTKGMTLRPAVALKTQALGDLVGRIKSAATLKLKGALVLPEVAR